MEIFQLSQSLKKQDFGVWLDLAKSFNLTEIIVFNADTLYVSNKEISLVSHLAFLWKIKTGSLKAADLTSGKYKLASIKQADIKRTHYSKKWDADLNVGVFGASVFEYPLNHFIRFYDRLNVETKDASICEADYIARIHSLWLAVPETRDALRPYLIPSAVETNIGEKGSWFDVHDDASVIGDENLYLIFDPKRDKWQRWSKRAYLRLL